MNFSSQSANVDMSAKISSNYLPSLKSVPCAVFLRQMWVYRRVCVWRVSGDIFGGAHPGGVEGRAAGPGALSLFIPSPWKPAKPRRERRYARAWQPRGRRRAMVPAKTGPGMCVLLSQPRFKGA